MADDLEEGEDERAVELASLAAIYPELVVDDTNSDPFSANISLEIEPIEPLSIRFPSADGAPPVGPLTPPDSTLEGISQFKIGEKGVVPATINDVHHLSHLPALKLLLSLPEGYPAEKPPVFYLESQYSWLPEQKLHELREAGHTLWEDLGRDQVVFSYIDHLREAAERGFDMAQADDQVLEISLDLKVSLLDFDLKAKRAKFERETFECGICLDAKKGTVCHRLLLCGHVFCVPCLQDFYISCITEGDIGNVKCIAPGCGKESEAGPADQIQPKKRLNDRTLEPSELLQIPLEQDTVQRYIKLKRKKRLESDRTTVYCPRQWCQGPARTSKSKPNQEEEGVEAEETDEPQTYDRNASQEELPPPAERLAICEDCNFAFCKVCKASWHGEYFTCFPRSQYELTAEEKASEDYMKLHTQPCPTCDARAQKTHGCNHMICFKCDTHFCYLCGAYLDKGNPYQHYNTVKSSCYMRLWELEGGDDGEFGHGFGGGVDRVPLEFDDGDEDDDDEDHEPPPMPVAAPGVQLAPVGPIVPFGPLRARAPPVRPVRERDPGLQRFLRMARDDEEDAWDSDDLPEISDDEWDDEE